MTTLAEVKKKPDASARRTPSSVVTLTPGALCLAAAAGLKRMVEMGKLSLRQRAERFISEEVDLEGKFIPDAQYEAKGRDLADYLKRFAEEEVALALEKLGVRK